MVLNPGRALTLDDLEDTEDASRSPMEMISDSTLKVTQTEEIL